VVVHPAPSPPLPALRVRPRHVAIIMDGNGRWAQARGLKRSDGHRAGASAIRPIVERFAEHGVEMLTLFGFSTENWGRSRAEVQTILRLASDFIDRHLDELDRRGVRLRHLGSLERLPKSLQRKVMAAVARTAANERLTLNIAFNYGGRADIVDAVRRLVADGLRPEEVTEETIASYLYTAGLPDPDLLIRTGGDQRVSNFLIWQAAYAEYYFSERNWPDFGPADVDAALVEYARRHRRFGLVTSEPPEDAGEAE
jgi:undecaprenyl diphosphate synthase